MLASNYRKFPDALIAQRELELVFAISDLVSELEMVLIEKTFSTGGAWLRHYAKKFTSIVKIPAWWAAMRKKALALARAVKAAIFPMF